MARRTREASAEYLAAIDLWQSLAREYPEEDRYRRALANAYTGLGSAERSIGQIDVATLRLEQAFRLWQGCAAGGVLSPQNLADMATTHFAYGATLLKSYRFTEAKPQLIEAIRLYRQAMSSGEHASYRTPAVLAFARRDLAYLSSLQGRLDVAESEYRAAIRIYVNLAEDFPDLPFFRFHLGVLHHDLSEVLLAARRDGEAEEALRHSREIAEELAARFPNQWKHNIELGTVYYRQGTMAYHANRVTEAEEAFTAAREQLEIVCRTPSDKPGRHRRLVVLLATCPAIQYRDPHRAVALARQSVATGTQNGRHWQLLGVAQYRAKQYREAIGTLQTSRQLRSGGDRFDRLFLAMAHWRLGEKDEARRWYDEAMDEARGGPRLNRDFTSLDLLRFQAEAETLMGQHPN